MKKLVFSFLLFGLAGLGGFSLWAGLTAQREYREAVHRFGEHPDVRVLEFTFERGWMHSSAETQFELHGEPGDAFKLALEALGTEDTRARVGFRMSYDIEHGPLPLWDWIATGLRGAPVMAEVSSVIEFDHESRAEFASVVGRVPSVSAHTVMRSSGSGETRFSAPSQVLETVTESGTRTVEWRGMQGSLFFAPGWQSFIGTVRSPGFAAAGPGLLVSAAGLEWTLDVREGEGLPLGESAWRIRSLRIEPIVDEDSASEEAAAQVADAADAVDTPDADEANAGDTPDADEAEAGDADPGAGLDEDFAVTLRGLGLGQASQVESGLYSGELWLAVETIEIGTAVYGPGELRLALTDVDADALRTLRRTTRRLEAQAASGEVSAETASAAVAGEMMEQLPALLTRSPRIELQSLALGLPSGELRGSGAVWFDGGGTAPAHFLEVLVGLGGELDVEAPALSVDTFFASLPDAAETEGPETGLADLRKRGVVIRDGAVYRARARWRNGQLTINGLPLEAVFPDDPEAEPDGEPEDDALSDEPAPLMAQILGLLAVTP